MSHHRQRQRKERIEKVRGWMPGHGTREVIERCIRTFGCTREKAIEYIAEVTKE